MTPQETNELLEGHVRNFFSGHKIESKRWTRGPVQTALPRLRVLEISPGPKASIWTYATVGAWEARPDNPLEFIMLANRADDRFVELLSITGYYALDHFLKIGDTMAIGEPVVPNSSCEYVYLSLPTYGPDLEEATVGSSHVHYYWLFPLTPEELSYLNEEGLEALEQRLESQGVEYWNPKRKSVVSHGGA